MNKARITIAFLIFSINHGSADAHSFPSGTEPQRESIRTIEHGHRKRGLHLAASVCNPHINEILMSDNRIHPEGVRKHCVPCHCSRETIHAQALYLPEGLVSSPVWIFRKLYELSQDPSVE